MAIPVCDSIFTDARRAAQALSITQDDFLALVKDGRMPPPIVIRGGQLWRSADLRDSAELLVDDNIVRVFEARR